MASSSKDKKDKIGGIFRFFKRQRGEDIEADKSSENTSYMTPNSTSLPLESSSMFSVTSPLMPSTQCPSMPSTQCPSIPSSFMPREDLDLQKLPSDPGERKKIFEFSSGIRDQVRRYYLSKPPNQPKEHVFPQTMIGSKLRRFNKDWFSQYPQWLEYSIKEDKVYCLCCYLFRDEFGNQGGGDSFVSKGFCGWNKALERFVAHVGNVNSAHNKAVEKCNNLVRSKQSIPVALDKQSDIMKNEYRVRLTASVDAVRFLLHQGLPFRGHDESETSNNRGNFLELVKLIADQNENARKVVLKNAPQNHQMTSPSVQKDIVDGFAKETLKAIIEEIGGDYFGLLVDESSDVSHKEQMCVVFRYVGKEGIVKERFMGIVHVEKTSSLTLKMAIESLIGDFGLSLQMIRGQGYDGASNMRGELGGLKTLILKENESAYYVHCFAHQLQLTLVSIARKHRDVCEFFDKISILLNVVGASCKRHDMIRHSHMKKVAQLIKDGEIETGKGKNQEIGLIRAGDTRWGSHYKSLMNLVELFSSVIEVLEVVSNESRDHGQRGQANGVLKYMQTFDFVFILQLMLIIFGSTHNLSMALQRKDQDIINSMTLVGLTKRELQEIRDEGWESLLKSVINFCDKYDIPTFVMEEEFVDPCKPRRRTYVTNEHHYRVEFFYSVVDMQLQELNDRFNEVNYELLLCVASLSPSNSLCDFDKQKLLKLTEFYPRDFSFSERMSLERQLNIYIHDVCSDDKFSRLERLGDLARVLVETKKHLSHPLVYRLIKLALILPISTASVERCFSAMNIVKLELRNRIGDEFLNNGLICYIEKDLFVDVTTETVVNRFQLMRTRRGQL